MLVVWHNSKFLYLHFLRKTLAEILLLFAFTSTIRTDMFKYCPFFVFDILLFIINWCSTIRIRNPWLCRVLEPTWVWGMIQVVTVLFFGKFTILDVWLPVIRIAEMTRGIGWCWRRNSRAPRCFCFADDLRLRVQAWRRHRIKGTVTTVVRTRIDSHRIWGGGRRIVRGWRNKGMLDMGKCYCYLCPRFAPSTPLFLRHSSSLVLCREGQEESFRQIHSWVHRRDYPIPIPKILQR